MRASLTFALGLVLGAGLLMGAVPRALGPSTIRPTVVGVGAVPPPYCAVGDLWIDTDETVDTNCTTTANNSLCVCHAANTWDTAE